MAEELAKWSLIQHMQHVHHATATEQQVGGVGIRKPEKFPRPMIDQDSTLESWNEFLSSWEQYRMNINYRETVLPDSSLNAAHLI